MGKMKELFYETNEMREPNVWDSTVDLVSKKMSEVAARATETLDNSIRKFGRNPFDIFDIDPQEFADCFTKALTA